MAMPALDDAVLRAAAQVIARHGWHDLTLERVAATAGVSRVTLYRRGVTKEALIDALRDRAAQGWRAAIWPALTSAGTAAERLREAVRASCEALELHLVLLAGLTTASNQVGALEGSPQAPLVCQPGQASAETEDVYIAPFARLLRDGAADGSLTAQAAPAVYATALFSILPGTYLQLRTAHGWDPEQAVTVLSDLLLHGLLPRTTD